MYDSGITEASAENRGRKLEVYFLSGTGEGRPLPPCLISRMANRRGFLQRLGGAITLTCGIA